MLYWFAFEFYAYTHFFYLILGGDVLLEINYNNQ